jgi:hypothetical protein
MHQTHLHFFESSAAFAMIAARACRDHIRPDMFPAQVLGQDVIDC